MNDPIFIAQAREPIYLLPKMANRHGLIAGATGTGKTVTLQTLAETFSARGVPVFMADVKGDLAGLSQPGGDNQRNLLALESQGADKFFGEPALDLDDLIQTQNGRGVINILAAEKLMQQSPKVYATFLLWLLSELFERLPEVGDPDKPKLVFFFDEAHLLFTDIAPAVEQKIE